MSHKEFNPATRRHFTVSDRFPDSYVRKVLPDADEPEDPLVAVDLYEAVSAVVSNLRGTRSPEIELMEAEPYGGRRLWF